MVFKHLIACNVPEQSGAFFMGEIGGAEGGNFMV